MYRVKITNVPIDVSSIELEEIFNSEGKQWNKEFFNLVGISKKN